MMAAGIAVAVPGPLPELIEVSHVAESADPSALAAILDPAVNLAIWARELAPVLAGAVAAFDFRHLAGIRFRCPVEAVLSEFARAAAAAGPADKSLPAILIDDVAALAARFSALMGAEMLDVRFEYLDGDACRRFHGDFVRARLITTYAGAGTQWLANDVAAAHRAGRPLASGEIRALGTGQVGIFKGADWPGAIPITHRSPPIAATGGTRVLLVIDVAEPPRAPA